MPKLYEYLGILIFFYSNEHEPVHVHARYGSKESRAEFVISNGNIEEIRIMPIRTSEPLTGNKLNDFKDFLEKYGEKIVEKWINYFILHKEVEFERINIRIK
jgi:hypothetical protein